MVDNHTVRRTFAAVIIILIFYAHCISCKPAYIRRDENGNINDIVDVDNNHKHLKFLKAADPEIVEAIKRRIKARMRGRKPDQSNERNLWRSHPKKLDYTGPDTDEVFGVISSIGI